MVHLSAHEAILQIAINQNEPQAFFLFRMPKEGFLKGLQVYKSPKCSWLGAQPVLLKEVSGEPFATLSFKLYFFIITQLDIHLNIRVPYI